MRTLIFHVTLIYECLVNSTKDIRSHASGGIIKVSMPTAKKRIREICCLAGQFCLRELELFMIKR